MTLRSFGRDGSEQLFEWDGLPAIIAQHETDHLDGAHYIDRLWSPAALAFDEEAGRYGTLTPDYLDSVGPG